MVNSADYYGSQIKRLASLKGWQWIEPEGRVELAQTLAMVSTDEIHGRRIIDSWLRDQTEMPTPADIRSMAALIAPNQEQPRPQYFANCPDCHGTGTKVRVDAEGYWWGSPCTCNLSGEPMRRASRREEFRARGICPDCEGAAMNCRACNGTGGFIATEKLRAEGICIFCYGMKELIHRPGKPCLACQGSGNGPRTNRELVRGLARAKSL